MLAASSVVSGVHAVVDAQYDASALILGAVVALAVCIITLYGLRHLLALIAATQVWVIGIGLL